MPHILISLSAILFSAVSLVASQVNIYSARHYDTDEALYAAFTEETGIKVNVIEAKGDELVQRLLAEGRNSRADILLTVDIGRLWEAETADLFAPVSSPTLEERIPAQFRHPEGLWFGLSKRVRILFVAPDRVDPAEVSTYQALADPKFRGRILVRSSSNIYNQSLLGSLIDRLGVAGAEAWAAGVVANMARPPQSNDTGQLRAVAAGEGDIAIANHYYYLRLQDSDRPEDRAVAAALVPVFPGQGKGEGGTHVNLSGAGVLKAAPNPEAAVRFLEFLTSAKAQALFASANYEFPVVEGVAAIDPDLSGYDFVEETVDAAVIGANNPEALRIFDRVGWR